jgi:hypothetical protein
MDMITSPDLAVTQSSAPTALVTHHPTGAVRDHSSESPRASHRADADAVGRVELVPLGDADGAFGADGCVATAVGTVVSDGEAGMAAGALGCTFALEAALDDGVAIGVAAPQPVTGTAERDN